MSDKSWERVELEGELVRQSDKAALIKFAGPDANEVEEWFPFSLIQDQAWVDKEKKQISCTIPEWLAVDRGVV